MPQDTSATVQLVHDQWMCRLILHLWANESYLSRKDICDLSFNYCDSCHFKVCNFYIGKYDNILLYDF